MERRSMAGINVSWLRFTCATATLVAAGLARGDDATPTSTGPTHSQVKTIRPTGGNAKLKLTAFCLTKDGKIVAVLNRNDVPVANPNAVQSDQSSSGGVLSALVAAFSGETTAESKPGDAAAAKAEDEAKPLDSVGEVRLLDADGKMLAQWPLDFLAQAVNVCPDGNIILGGDGLVARFDMQGKQLARAEAPHVAGKKTTQKEFEDRAREALKGQVTAYEDALKALEKQQEELNKKKDSELSDEEKQMKLQMNGTLQAYKNAIEQAKQPADSQVSEMAKYMANRERGINAIAADKDHVFITCGDVKGFGYSVWRADLDFGNPKQIVSGLSGCCGQMDVQCCNDELVVAENSRKRVVRYDAEGKKVAHFGKGSRDGEGDTFGSCCNPMNTRFHDGKLYVSDSDGRVRLFSVDGKYEGEVGKAKVQEGCKSSIVDVSPDGNRVYYIDVNNSQICVLERKPANDKQASVQ